MKIKEFTVKVTHEIDDGGQLVRMLLNDRPVKFHTQVDNQTFAPQLVVTIDVLYMSEKNH